MNSNLPPAAGDNAAPDYAKEVTDRMAREYAELVATQDRLLEEARNMPVRVDDDQTMGIMAALVVRIRDTAARAKAIHAQEKEPYLRGGEGVDQFFFGIVDKLARRDRKNKPGAADILHARVHDWNERKEAMERARLAKEAEEARQAKEAAEAEERRIAKEKEEARLAAERARKPEKIEEKIAVAESKEQELVVAKIDTTIAADKHAQAEVATYRKPAELVRTRHDTGVMTTMGREPYAVVEPGGHDKLDKEKLWPFISDEAKEKALRAWAKTTGHKVEMAGASIGFRNKTINR